MLKLARPPWSPNGRKPQRRGSQAPSAPGMMEVRDFGPNPGDLALRLYVPDDLPVGAPLVVVLHGCTQTASGYAMGAGWLTLADRFGFAVMCPEQKRANNPNLCFNWFQPDDTTRGAGEAASIAAMVRFALNEHALDRDRVFVTGLSAGGAMTAVMLATYPEVFAAGAVIAGLPYGSADSMATAFGAMMQPQALPGPAWGDKVREASSHSGRWPTIAVWHGASDMTVRPPAGEALVRQWVNVHDVRGGPEAATTADGRSYEVWRTPDGRAVVEMHRIPGMAHGAPLRTGGAEGNGAAGAFLLEVGISSSLEIARTWGIAPVRVGAPVMDARDARPDPDKSGRNLSPEVAPPELVASRPNQIKTTIEAALRSAGLMR